MTSPQAVLYVLSKEFSSYFKETAKADVGRLQQKLNVCLKCASYISYKPKICDYSIHNKKWYMTLP